MQTLKEKAKSLGYEIRHYTQPLAKHESVNDTIRPFDFSNSNGGTLDAHKYYNDYYLIKTN